MSIADELAKLEQLRQAGTLSDAEFQTQKQCLLHPPAPPRGEGRPLEANLPMPETYLWQAIFVTLFCCLPVGIYAIIKASDVSGMYSRGQYELALVRSNEARSATNLALILGLLVGVGWFVFVVRLGGAFGRF